MQKPSSLISVRKKIQLSLGSVLAVKYLMSIAVTYINNLALSCIEKDHYYVSVLVHAWYYQNSITLEGIKIMEHNPPFWKKEQQILLVTGELNFKFESWTKANNNQIKWLCKDTEDTECYGLTRIEGVHDDGILHAVVVKGGCLDCSNIIDKNGEHFSASVSKFLPMKKVVDGQYRVIKQRQKNIPEEHNWVYRRIVA